MLRGLFRRPRTSAKAPAAVESQTWDAPADADLVEQVTSQAMRARYQELRRDRGEVRALEYMLGWPRVLEWVHSVGVVQDQRLREFVAPLPPRELRSITAEPELEPFLWTGLVEARLMLEAHARHARGTRAARPRVLDFGCGCGRLLRFLALRPDRWSAVGCDVNATHVRWCGANLRGVDVREVGVWPPCPYEDAAFDLVYCLSVFTHLPEERALAWLADLARVLSPGGVLVATTSGVPSLETIRTSRLHQEMFRLEAPVVARLLESFETDGFRYFRYDEDVLRLARAGEDYGNAFVHPEHVRRRWVDPRLELVEHRVGGLHSWQDVVVWRRR